MRRTLTLMTAVATVFAMSSTAEAARIVGTPGDDVLIGTPGDDRIVGADGDDVMDGGPGSDVAQGSAGDDTATYVIAENAMSSDDYRGASGFDQLVIIIPSGLSAGEIADLQAGVDAYHAFRATMPEEGERFRFAPYGFDLTVRGFEDLETNAVAVDDAATTDEDTALAVPAPGVLGNDINLDGDPLTVTEVEGSAADVGVQIALGSGALLTANADGSFSYDPNGQFEFLAVGESTIDSFTYTMTDGTFSSSATVTITIDGVNDAPVAQDVDDDASEDGPAITGAFDADDVDSDDDPSTLTYTVVTPPTKGQLTNNGDGSFEYDPNGEFESLADGDKEDVTFTYTATDDHGAVSNTATVTITIDGQNDAPVAQDATFDVDEDAADGTSVGTVTATDVDAGDVLSFAITAGDPDGVFAIGASTGEITVNDPPGLDFDAQATYDLTVTVTDLLGASDTAAVTIDVNEVVTNTPPDAPDTDLSGGTKCLLTGAPAPYACDVAFPAGTLGGVDGDGDALTVAAVANTGVTFPLGGRTCNAQGLCTTDNQFVPASSTLTVNGDGSFSIHYETNQCPLFPSGTLFAEFEFSVTETGTVEGFSDTGIATVAVQAANNGCN